MFFSLVLQQIPPKHFVPPMATNPIYDGAELEIYEFIPQITTLTFPLEEPPTLPPPRRATMDVSTPKSTHDSIEAMTTTINEASNPAATAINMEEGTDDYVPMGSSLEVTSSTPPNGCPRYTEPPTLAGSQPSISARKYSVDEHTARRDNLNRVNLDEYDRLATL